MNTTQVLDSAAERRRRARLLLGRRPLFHRIPLPAGLERTLEDLSREVLRYQPADICRFCAEFFQRRLAAREGQLTEKLLPAAGDDAVADDAEKGTTEAGQEATEAAGEAAETRDTAVADPASTAAEQRATSQADSSDSGNADGATDDERMLLGALGAAGAGAVTVGAVAGALKAAQDREAADDLQRREARPFSGSHDDASAESAAAAAGGPIASVSAETAEDGATVSQSRNASPYDDQKARVPSALRSDSASSPAENLGKDGSFDPVSAPISPRDAGSAGGTPTPHSPKVSPDQMDIESDVKEPASSLKPPEDESSVPSETRDEKSAHDIHESPQSISQAEDVAPSSRPTSKSGMTSPLSDRTGYAEVPMASEVEDKAGTASNTDSRPKSADEPDSKTQTKGSETEAIAKSPARVSQKQSTEILPPDNVPGVDPGNEADSLPEDRTTSSQHVSEAASHPASHKESHTDSRAESTTLTADSANDDVAAAAAKDESDKSTTEGGRSSIAEASSEVSSNIPTQSEATMDGLGSKTGGFDEPLNIPKDATDKTADEESDQPLPLAAGTPASAARMSAHAEVDTPEVVAELRPQRQHGSDEWQKLEWSSEPVAEGQARSVSQLSGLQQVYDEMEDKRLSAEEDGSGIDSRAQSSAGAVVGSSVDLQQEQGLQSPIPSIQEDVIVKVDRFASQDEALAPTEQLAADSCETAPDITSAQTDLAEGPEQQKLPSPFSETIEKGEMARTDAGEDQEPRSDILQEEEVSLDKPVGYNVAMSEDRDMKVSSPEDYKEGILKALETPRGKLEGLEVPGEGWNVSENLEAAQEASERTEDIEYDPLALTQSAIFPDDLAGGRASAFSEKPSSPFPAIKDSEGNVSSLSRINLDQKEPSDSAADFAATSSPEKTIPDEQDKTAGSKLDDAPGTASEVSSPKQDEDSDSKEEPMSASEAAATKIQAGVRGWQVRRKISQQNAAATQIQAGFRGWKVRRERKLQRTESLPDLSQKPLDTDSGNFMDVDELKNRAASKIQAGFRGWKTRQGMKSTKGETSEDSDHLRAGDAITNADVDISPAISMSNVSAEDQAAAKIQAGFRGWKTRKTLHRSLSDPNSEAMVLAPAPHHSGVQESTSTLQQTTPSEEVATPREEDETAHSIQSIQSEVATTPREGGALTERQDPSNDTSDRQLEDAAAKIQAGYRGWKTRQELGEPADPAEPPGAEMARPTDSAKSVTDSGALPIDYAIVHRPEDDWVTSELQKLDAQKAAEEDSDSASSWLTRAQSDIRASFQGLRDNVTDALRTVEETAGLVQDQEGTAPLAVHPAAATVADKGAVNEPSAAAQRLAQTSGVEGDIADSTRKTSESSHELSTEDSDINAAMATSPSEREEQEIWEEIKRNMQFDD